MDVPLKAHPFEEIYIEPWPRGRSNVLKTNAHSISCSKITFLVFINPYIIQIYKELKISVMKTKSKNFGNQRSLYLSFGLFNQIRDTSATKTQPNLLRTVYICINSCDECTDVLFDNHLMLC